MNRSITKAIMDGLALGFLIVIMLVLFSIDGQLKALVAAAYR